jgi:hypothetical protein
MKKKILLGLILCIGLGLGATYLRAGCGGCSVSSNSSENIGRCKACVEGGDACTNATRGPKCSGNSDDTEL